MKCLSFTAILLLSAIATFSQQPSVCAISSSQQFCTTNQLGLKGPCDDIYFVVNHPVPPGFDYPFSYRWFVNSTQVKYTETISDDVLPTKVQSQTMNVYCQVTYINLSTQQHSPAYTSNTFAVNIDPLPWVLYPPVSVDLGVQSANFTISGPSDAVFTWASLSSWTLASTSNNGKNATFTTTVADPGIVKVTATKQACNYQETKTVTIPRTHSAPSVVNFPGDLCNATNTTISINPMPYANSYTYTASARTGEPVYFTVNGQSSITTTATSLDLTLANNSSYVVDVYVTANYIDGQSSGSLDHFFSVFAPAYWNPGYTWNTTPTTDGSEYAITIDPLSGASQYYWYVQDFLTDVSTGSFSSGLWYHDYQYLKVQAKTPCGLTDFIYIPFPNSFAQAMSLPKGEDLLLYPNPSSDIINIELKSDDKTKLAGLKEIKQITISNYNGASVKNVNYKKGTKRAVIDIHSLKKDLYIINVTDGQIIRSLRFSKTN